MKTSFELTAQLPAHLRQDLEDMVLNQRCLKGLLELYAQELLDRSDEWFTKDSKASLVIDYDIVAGQVAIAAKIVPIDQSNPMKGNAMVATINRLSQLGYAQLALACIMELIGKLSAGRDEDYDNQLGEIQDPISRAINQAEYLYDFST